MSNQNINYENIQSLFVTLTKLLGNDFLPKNDKEFRNILIEMCPNQEEFLLANRSIPFECFITFWEKTYPEIALMCIKKQIISDCVGEGPKFHFTTEIINGSSQSPNYCIIITSFQIDTIEKHYQLI